MTKRIALVGHCGPDSSYLRLTVASAVKNANVVMANDETSLSRLIESGVDLLLVNRQLDYGFATYEGIELIRRLHKQHPTLRTMLVSNYSDAQEAAEQAGALPGFGKSELGTDRVRELIRAAVEQISGVS